MKKTPIYTYLGTNGILTSAIHLEGIYYTLSYRLEADDNKMLTNDNGKTLLKTVTISSDELDEWKEVYPKVSSK